MRRQNVPPTIVAVTTLEAAGDICHDTSMTCMDEPYRRYAAPVIPRLFRIMGGPARADNLGDDPDVSGRGVTLALAAPAAGDGFRLPGQEGAPADS